MKSLTLKQTIELPELLKVVINNELMTVNLVQSEDNNVHVVAEIAFRDNEEGELTIEDFVSAKSNFSDKVITLYLENNEDVDISSSQSSMVIAIPVNVSVEAESDNYPIIAKTMRNDLNLSNENGLIRLETCQGNCTIHNENGSVKLIDIAGELSLEMENGAVSADNIQGESLEINSENGGIKLRNCNFAKVNINNENGSVYYESLPVDSGSIEIGNENGHIHLSLSPSQGFNLEASTEEGIIKNNFMGAGIQAQGTYCASVGDESLSIKLSTENGIIKISSGDNMNADYLKGKFEQLKDKIKDNSEDSLKEAYQIIAQLTTYLKNTLQTVNEQYVKEKIELAIDQLNKWKEKINDPDMKETVKDTMESLAKDIQKSVSEAVKNIKDKIEKEVKVRIIRADSEAGQHGKHSYGFDKFDFMKNLEPLKHLGRYFNQVPPEQGAMQDKSRMKILEMLESGKITAEEAEKLLRAIGKD